LIPDWQFNGSETSWTYHTGGLSTDLRLESVEWTDGRLVRVATCTEKHHTDCYPSWRMSELIPVNPSLAYEFSIYIKSTGRDLNNYFGYYAYDSNKQPISSPWSNPYFKKTDNDEYTWKRWNGYILPYYIFDTNKDGKADRQSHYSNGVDWVWPSNAHYVKSPVW
jgi:hypothetical protein